MYLHAATLYYGTSAYPVKDEQVFGIPSEFDFKHPEQCATRALIGMARACGGHTLHDCRVAYHPLRHTASVTANGASVHYAPRDCTPLTVEQAIALIAETVIIQLPTITQYGPAGTLGYNW